MEPDFRGCYSVFVKSFNGVDDEVLRKHGSPFNVSNKGNIAFARFKTEAEALKYIEDLNRETDYQATPAKNKPVAERTGPSGERSRGAEHKGSKKSDEETEKRPNPSDELPDESSIGFNRSKGRNLPKKGLQETAAPGPTSPMEASPAPQQYRRYPSSPMGSTMQMESSATPPHQQPFSPLGSSMSINTDKARSMEEVSERNPNNVDVIFIDTKNCTVTSEGLSLLEAKVNEAKAMYQQNYAKAYSQLDNLECVATPLGWKPYITRKRPTCSSHALDVFIKAHCISKQDLPLLREEYFKALKAEQGKVPFVPISSPLAFHQDCIDQEVIQELPLFMASDLLIANLPFWYCQGDVYQLLSLLIPNEIVQIDYTNKRVLGEIPHAVVHVKTPRSAFIVHTILDKAIVCGKSLMVATMDEVVEFIQNHLVKKAC